jgi:imidazolonepropionase-like amidohydrolase
MRGDEVIEDGVDRRRAATGSSPSARARSTMCRNARVIDVAGRRSLPGWIDVHWHGAQGTGQIIPRQNWVNYSSLAFGVTTIHDPSNDTASRSSRQRARSRGRGRRAARLLDRHDPLRREGSVHGHDRRSKTPSRTSAG